MTALLNMSAKLTYLLAVGIVLVLGSSAWWLWKRGKKNQSSDRVESNEPDAETRTNSEAVLVKDDAPTSTSKPTSEAPKKALDHSALLIEIAKRCDASDSREFMEDIVQRIRDEGSQFDSSTPYDFVEEIVDRIDDLRLLSDKAAPYDAPDIGEFITILTDLLKDCEVELLHSESWNPEIQRALSKNPTEGISETKIMSFGSTGISRDSKLIRKQEVVLAIPKPN